jgi:type IV secretion system protein VirD4
MSRGETGGRNWRVRFFLGAVVSVVLGMRMAQTPDTTPLRGYWPLLVISGVVTLLVLVMSSPRRRAGGGFGTGGGRVQAGASVLFTAAVPRGSVGTVRHWSQRSRRNHGVASRWSIWRLASGRAVRRKAGVLRPGLTGGDRRVRALDVASPIATVGIQRVWSTVEDVTLRVGGPRTGKSGELGGRILDAQGAVIATSTRTDLVQLCGPLRERVGPVRVFNPSGLGGQASTVVFDPLAGCECPSTATQRAADLMSGSGMSSSGSGEDRAFWTGQGARVLAALMHAAALGDGCSMRDVQAWIADPDGGKNVVTRYLRRSSEPTFETDAAQFLSTNERTRSSITTTIMPALGWLSDTVAYACTQPGDGRVELDVAELLTSRGTVFMLGAEDAQTAPLVTALTAHIAREARRIAALSPGGRLEPPLTLVLDEAALICPIPLDRWTADMGGRNVTIHIGAQSRAQLRQRWGDHGAAAIMNNAATILVYGGTRDPDDLHAYSTLSGERQESMPSWDESRRASSWSVRTVPVLSPAQIAQLPAQRVMIIRRGMAPMIGRVEMAWDRSDVRALHRAERVAELSARCVRITRSCVVWAELHTRSPRAWLKERVAVLRAFLDPVEDSGEPVEDGQPVGRAS